MGAKGMRCGSDGDKKQQGIEAMIDAVVATGETRW
jgi:hypothetical protein